MASRLPLEYYIILCAVDNKCCGQEFKALILHYRLKRKGPQNQYFVNQIEALEENNAQENSDDEAQPVDDKASGNE